MKRVIIPIGILSFVLTGCSLMPYHDKFMCEGGSNIKICKRVSDVLQESDEINTDTGCSCNKTKTQTQKAPNQKICQNAVIQAKKIVDENKKLKNMIEAISLEELQKPVKVEVECKNYKTPSSQKNYIPLNKTVKVCVYNANIREEPNCQAKIVKVVKKGTKLHAIALINNTWIKLKDGYIHKSLICGECNETRIASHISTAIVSGFLKTFSRN